MSSEIKIIVILVASLIGLEVGTRLAEPRLSKDLAHIGTYPDLESRFRSAGNGDSSAGMKVLVLGNSLARRGIDKKLLVDGLTEPGGNPPVVGFITPDGSSVTEWAWAYRRYLMHPGAKPDLVIVMTGQHHLVDDTREQLDIPRLAAFYLSAKDRAEFVSRYSIGSEQRLELLLASQSRLLADRTRLRPLLFYRTVPGYEVGVNQINAALGGGVPVASTDKTTLPKVETTDTLNLLIESVNASGARLVVVTAPLPDPYSLSGAVMGLLQKQGVATLLLGETLLLPDDRFPDGYHLDEVGAAKVTGELLRMLEPD